MSFQINETPAADPWWVQLHRWLLPDYNRAATRYWWSIALVGYIALGIAISQVADMPSTTLAQVLLGVAITGAAGLFPVRLPGTKSAVVAGDIFMFVMLAIYGPFAATLAAAAEATTGTWRASTRWSSRLISPALCAIAMTVCGHSYQLATDALAGTDWYGVGVFAGLLILTAGFYTFCNTFLIGTLMNLKRGQLHTLQAWFRESGWVTVPFMAAAGISAMLVLTFQKFGVAVLVVSVPMIALLLATLHYFYAQQEAAARERQARTEAAEREAAQAAAHVRELERSEKRFHSAFTHASIGMALVTTQGKVLQVNPALSLLLGRHESDITGRDFAEFLYAEDSGLLREQLSRVLTREVEAFSIELRCRHQRGHELWTALNCSFFSDAESTEPCLIFQLQDITARRRAESRLQHIAYHDSLTNLANRSRFHDALLHAIESHRTDGKRRFAVLFLDFDRFKLINDSLGHSVGDEFLVKVARRIQDQLSPYDLVARLGGDEFAILTRYQGDPTVVLGLAERLQETLRTPIQVAGRELSSSACIGITVSDFGYRTPEEVLRDADLAMYKAKGQGTAKIALFDAGLHQRASEQLILESDLRRALTSHQLQLVYQPVFELSPQRLVGFEALVRWNHPERGLIHPNTFIPLAEESGLIEPLNQWVTDEACAQLHAWHDLYPSLSHLKMHINLSGCELADTRFAARINDKLGLLGLRPSSVVFEITENILMERVSIALDTMRQLRDLGVGLSIDDFGTGYSSLAYLSTLPITSLKIDRSFIKQLQTNSDDSEIVRAVVMLGMSLGKEVVAEGIETEAQLQKLRQIGCAMGQGFALAEPLTARQAAGLLAGIAMEPVQEPTIADTPSLSLSEALAGARRLH